MKPIIGLILLLLFCFKLFSAEPIVRPSNQDFLDHFHRTERLFKRYQPEATQWEAFRFAKASWYGSHGEIDIIPLDSCLSCREGGYKTKNGQGRMGGHKKTILAGSRILDGPIDDLDYRWKWLNKHPDHKIACLSAQFAKLYRLHGKEEAVRRWVKGNDWKNQEAKNYWEDVQIMEDYYYGRRNTRSAKTN